MPKSHSTDIRTALMALLYKPICGVIPAPLYGTWHARDKRGHHTRPLASDHEVNQNQPAYLNHAFYPTIEIKHISILVSWGQGIQLSNLTPLSPPQKKEKKKKQLIKLNQLQIWTSRKRNKKKKLIRLNQLPTRPYILATIPLGKTTHWYLRPCTCLCPL